MSFSVFCMFLWLNKRRYPMRFLAAFVAVGATLAFLRRSRQIREHEDYVGTPAVRLEEGERGSDVGKFPQTKHLVVMRVCVCFFLLVVSIKSVILH